MIQSADVISNIIKEQIKNYESSVEMSETGTVVVVGDGDNVAVAHREPVLEERVVVLRQIHSVCVLKSLSRVCRCVGDFCNGAVNNRRGEVGICAEIADGDAV